MAELSGPDVTKTGSAPSKTNVNVFGEPVMLSPANAWRLLCRRTGGRVSRATFYRWLSNGKVYFIRMGFRIFVPLYSLDDLVRLCLTGEKF